MVVEFGCCCSLSSCLGVTPLMNLHLELMPLVDAAIASHFTNIPIVVSCHSLISIRVY